MYFSQHQSKDPILGVATFQDCSFFQDSVEVNNVIRLILEIPGEKGKYFFHEPLLHRHQLYFVFEIWDIFCTHDLIMQLVEEYIKMAFLPVN